MLIHIHVLPCTNFHYPLKRVGVENVCNTELKWKIGTKSLAITEYSECQTRHECIISFKISFLKTGKCNWRPKTTVQLPTIHDREDDKSKLKY